MEHHWAVRRSVVVRHRRCIRVWPLLRTLRVSTHAYSILFSLTTPLWALCHLRGRCQVWVLVPLACHLVHLPHRCLRASRVVLLVAWPLLELQEVRRRVVASSAALRLLASRALPRVVIRHLPVLLALLLRVEVAYRLVGRQVLLRVVVLLLLLRRALLAPRTRRLVARAHPEAVHH